MKKDKNKDYLDFEGDVLDIDSKIEGLKKLSLEKGIDYSNELNKLEIKKTHELKKIYSNLSAWQIVQVARHFNRPIFQDYLKGMIFDFRELHGDMCFRDDRAIITGLGKIREEKVMIIGQNKGKTLNEKINCNFGCAMPEGYRKAILKMKFAEKYQIPIVTFIDTPGAYPGVGAEERGQASAIAYNLREMSRLKVPIISIVIGEGGSGGALGIGVGDKLAMLEYSYCSVISPEGCAAILWRDKRKAPEAAEALKLTSKDLYSRGLIDGIIKEPIGGAHRNYFFVFNNVEEYIVSNLEELKNINVTELLEKRYKRLRSIGKKI